MPVSRSTDPHGSVMYPLREDWLALQDEKVIDPGQPIIDPHHHLWDRAGTRYLLDELLDDTNTGHDIRSTVFIQCRSMYRADGPDELKCVGETEFVNGIAAMSASGNYGATRACEGIVSHADFRIGERVREVLEAQVVASERLVGIRYSTARHDDYVITPLVPPHRIMMDAKWREGFAELAPLDLTFDALVFHTQLAEVTDLARAFPDTTIILDHVGCVLGVGPLAGKRDEQLAPWRKSITELGKCQNVYVKLGGLTMPMFGFEFEKQPRPPSSEQLAQTWRPYIETCIDAFTPERAMFESNFPVDKVGCSYKVCWNAFKRLAEKYSADEKAWLFHKAASRAYSLTEIED